MIIQIYFHGNNFENSFKFYKARRNGFLYWAKYTETAERETYFGDNYVKEILCRY